MPETVDSRPSRPLPRCLASSSCIDARSRPGCATSIRLRGLSSAQPANPRSPRRPPASPPSAVAVRSALSTSSPPRRKTHALEGKAVDQPVAGAPGGHQCLGQGARQLRRIPRSHEAKGLAATEDGPPGPWSPGRAPSRSGSACRRSCGTIQARCRAQQRHGHPAPGAGRAGAPAEVRGHLPADERGHLRRHPAVGAQDGVRPRHRPLRARRSAASRCSAAASTWRWTARTTWWPSPATWLRTSPWRRACARVATDFQLSAADAVARAFKDLTGTALSAPLDGEHRHAG